MTNGGGASENDRARRLTELLGFEVGPMISLFLCLCFSKITASNFMQSHTILKSYVHKYVNKPVLVLGGKGDVLRKVAERCKRYQSDISRVKYDWYKLRTSTGVHHFGCQGMESRVSYHRFNRLSLAAHLMHLSVYGLFMTSPLRRGRLLRLVCCFWIAFILTWAVAN